MTNEHIYMQDLVLSFIGLVVMFATIYLVYHVLKDSTFHAKKDPLKKISLTAIDAIRKSSQ